MIFASEMADFEVSTAENVDFSLLPHNNSTTTDLAKQNMIMQFKCKLNDGGHVMWKGISQSEIIDIAQKRSSPDLVADEDTEWEEVVDRLSFANEIMIHCLTSTPGPFDDWLLYFTELMRTTIQHGNFWFWKLEAKAEQDVRSPPRWLVSKWWPIHDEEGEVIQVIPYAWASLDRPSVWPDARTLRMYRSWIKWEEESTKGSTDIWDFN